MQLQIDLHGSRSLSRGLRSNAFTQASLCKRFLLLASLGLLACGSETEGSTGCAEQAVLGGSSSWPDPNTANLAEAIGYVWISDPMQKGSERLCSVTRTRQGKGITAAHCIGTSSTWLAWIGFGPTAVAVPSKCAEIAEPLAAVTRHTPHPLLDIDVLDFEDAGGTQLQFATTAPDLGAAVLLAGYGVDESGTFGERRFAESVVVAQDDDTITVSSNGQTGACVGDSGGPLLARDTAGAYSVVGVLQEGSLSCKGRDIYTSAASITPWLEQAEAL